MCSLILQKSVVELVRFLSDLNREKDKGKKGEGNIDITTLIELNEELFR